MLKKFLIASAAGLLLAACQQQPQMASSPPAAPLQQPLQQLYIVYFNTGQSDLSPEAAATVSQAAAAFKQGGTVAVRGHTDTVGNPEFNLRLSVQRSASVKDALQRNGVPAAAIRSGGLGEQDLPVPTADQVPERLNRSVHITVVSGGAAAHERQGLLCRACQEVAYVFPDGRIWSGAAGDRPVRCRKLRRGHHYAGDGTDERQDPIAVALFVT